MANRGHSGEASTSSSSGGTRSSKPDIDILANSDSNNSSDSCLSIGTDEETHKLVYPVPRTGLLPGMGLPPALPGPSLNHSLLPLLPLTSLRGPMMTLHGLHRPFTPPHDLS
jgi:hypothetical protein